MRNRRFCSFFSATHNPKVVLKCGFFFQNHSLNLKNCTNTVATAKTPLILDKRLTLCNVQRYLSPAPPNKSLPIRSSSITLPHSALDKSVINTPQWTSLFYGRSRSNTFYDTRERTRKKNVDFREQSFGSAVRNPG